VSDELHMKVLVIHNEYQQPGGEDAAADAESRQLLAHGHSVMRYGRHNDELLDVGPLGAIRKGIQTVWASKSYRELKNLLAQDKPDIAHFHNTFPLISPSAYYACAEAGVPVVQTLHNYRLICPGATFMRQGRVCESCLEKRSFLPGVVHRCYRTSFPQTAVLATMLAAHKAMGTWRSKVNLYIALSEFARRKFVQGGLPSPRVVVKPNFVHLDHGPKTNRGNYALFVGRLSAEKGLKVLLGAWRVLARRIPLYVVGDGPMGDELHAEIKQLNLPDVTLVGGIASGEVPKWMHDARFLVCPSLSFEGFPMVIAEAYACGLPVIASRLGSLEEIVRDEQTGLHFSPGDPVDLAHKVEWAWTHEADISRISRTARAEFEQKYTAEQNYQNLMRIYGQVSDSVGELRAGPRRSSRNPGMRAHREEASARVRRSELQTHDVI